ncbi:RimJ/RimL family protein N-acetyltransferase [Haloactinospora alba]|uniref:RimJ/RimL family protein N-acetyltransferase n=1 Tax=Haloactinospora alba TaxID=405555 RepID=A0A543NIC7_9ACTN|nr:GNAT family N-acetyltransferase [Haloactinospora alba]TQN31598.1 RimJ/RimL family protein N-acetyltransferase [Haloactinospora alba]
MATEIHTERLVIREWRVTDAEAALAVYGAEDVARWLAPEMELVTDVATMRLVLQAWIEAQPNMVPPAGRWALVRREDDQVVGGVSLRLLPPFEEDFELSWQIRPDMWGRGYATEASRPLVRWAFGQGVEELFAVARPNNTRAIATARGLGMEWVGETDKYYGILLQVFRVRPDDIREGV